MTKRILLVASGGGHWVQLGRLSHAFAAHDVRFVTTIRGSTAPIGTAAVTIVPDASRQEPFRLIALWARMFFLILRFRPDLVVTTGAAPGLLAIQIGRILGASTIWVDSVANSEKLSMSGALARRHADLWLTQWPHLVDDYPGIRCVGRVF